MFDNNFGKCGSIFTIRSPIDLWENSRCTYYRDFQLSLSNRPKYTRCCKRTILFQVIVEDLVTCFFGTQCTSPTQSGRGDVTTLTLLEF